MDFNTDYSIALGYHDLSSSAAGDKVKLFLFNETTGETLQNSASNPNEYEVVDIQDQAPLDGVVRLYVPDNSHTYYFAAYS